ncbi:MAG: DEAD/DEAH box helicase family protein, partial [Acidimicrobiales bacterium]
MPPRYEDSPTNTQLDLIQTGAGTVMPKRARDHQQEAIRSVAEAFRAGANRCQVVMACGTGKTLVAQRVSEHKNIARDGLTVVACPSISLLAQTLTAWRADSEHTFARLAVCSDPSVEAAVAGPDEPSDSLASLAAATGGALVTTSTTDIKRWLDENEGRNVVFSTHASLGRVAEALASLDRAADLLVVDEAHNVAGTVDAASLAGKLHLGELATRSFP